MAWAYHCGVPNWAERLQCRACGAGAPPGNEAAGGATVPEQLRPLPLYVLLDILRVADYVVGAGRGVPPEVVVAAAWRLRTWCTEAWQGEA
ncbi:MAG: hypothetical protein GY772_24725 [bacterium]|nr:hypothetical protein [bacterium]